LAGSERLNEFDAKSEGIGETGFINKSLFVLSNVISKLAERKPFFYLEVLFLIEIQNLQEFWLQL